MLLLLWEYGSRPASLFFLKFELPNSEILICITHSSLQPFKNLMVIQLKSTGQNKRGGQKSMLSSETIFSLLTQVTREQIRGLFIYILLHHVQTKTLDKKRLADIQQLGLMKGTFVRWLISKCKTLKVKHQMEMNHTIPLWAEPNFPCLAGAILLRSLSPSSSQPGHTNIVENESPH